MFRTICASGLCLLFLSACPTLCQDGIDTPTCSQKFSRSNGTIESPRNLSAYGVKGFCTYAVTVSPTKQISMRFEQVKLNHQIYMLLEYVVLFDGHDCMAQRIGVVYGNRTPTIISSGNSMTALFASNSFFGAAQFSAIYTTVTGQSRTEPVSPHVNNGILDKCGEELGGRSGNFKFTGRSRENSLCIWRIKVSVGRRVHLRFTMTNLGPLSAWLRVLDGENCDAPVMQLITGSRKAPYPEFDSSSNVLVVVYASSSSSEKAQLEASYWEVTNPASTTEKTTLTSEMNNAGESATVSGMPVRSLPTDSTTYVEEMANNPAVSNKFSLTANSVGYAIAGMILLLLAVA